jgi:hypothetical protein
MRDNLETMMSDEGKNQILESGEQSLADINGTLFRRIERRGAN